MSCHGNHTHNLLVAMVSITHSLHCHYEQNVCCTDTSSVCVCVCAACMLCVLCVCVCVLRVCMLCVVCCVCVGSQGTPLYAIPPLHSG